MTSTGTSMLASSGQRGYAMAALLVGMSVMAVLMTVAMPVWKQASQREKEEELIFRGRQYARAVGLYGKKYANANPPTIDILVEQRFLRRKYKDPITGTDFLPLIAGQPIPGGTPQPGRGGTATTAAPGTQQGSSADPRQPTASPQGPSTPVPSQPTTAPGAGGRGGIIGVASRSRERSIRVYNGRNRYSEWAFLYTPPSVVPGAGVPGTAQPGQRGPATGRGGAPSPFSSGGSGFGIPGTASPAGLPR